MLLRWLVAALWAAAASGATTLRVTARPTANHRHDRPSTSLQCVNLLDARRSLPMTGNKDSCTSVPGLSLISNTNYSICVRHQSNLVDNTLKATLGRWPDCDLITDMLKGFNGMIRPVQSPQSTILDVGANIGSCSIALAAQGHRVISFEPKPEHVAMIKASADSNHHRHSGSIFLHECGLSDVATGAARLATEAGNSGNSWVLVDSKTSTPPTDAASIGGVAGQAVDMEHNISLRRLDDYCDVAFDAVKVDAQGFEATIFAGARRMLQHGLLKRIMLEYWPYGLEAHGHSSASLLQQLVDSRYALFTENGTRIVPATFYAFDTEMRNSGNGPGRGFGHLFAFHESVML
jgi:FkbM family methyltransferase